MRMTFTLLCATAMAVVSFTLVGCGSSQPDADHADHDQAAVDQAVDAHAGHDHAAVNQAGDEHAGHDHSGEGAQGGHFIALGDNEYQAELLHDETSGKITIHLLDSTAKKPVAIPSPTITLQLFSEGKFIGYELKAVASEPGGKTASQFELVDAVLSKALDAKQPVRGRLQLTIAGKEYSADVEHESHEDHEH